MNQTRIRKLLPGDVDAIITKYREGKTQAELSRQYGVNQQRISAILRKANADVGKRNVKPVVPIPSPEIEHLREIRDDKSLDDGIRLRAAMKLKTLETPQAPTLTGPSKPFVTDIDHLEDAFGPIKPAPRPVVKPETRDQLEARWARERAAREAKNVEEAKNRPPRTDYLNPEYAPKPAPALPRPYNPPVKDPSAFRERDIWSRVARTVNQQSWAQGLGPDPWEQ
jgi:hypothetical protein